MKKGLHNQPRGYILKKKLEKFIANARAALIQLVNNQ